MDLDQISGKVDLDRISGKVDLERIFGKVNFDRISIKVDLDLISVYLDLLPDLPFNWTGYSANFAECTVYFDRIFGYYDRIFGYLRTKTRCPSTSGSSAMYVYPVHLDRISGYSTEITMECDKKVTYPEYGPDLISRSRNKIHWANS